MECVAPYSLSNQKQAVYLFKKFKIYRFGPNQSFILIQTIKGKMQQLKVCKLNDDQAQPQRGYNIPMCKSSICGLIHVWNFNDKPEPTAN